MLLNVFNVITRVKIIRIVERPFLYVLDTQIVLSELHYSLRTKKTYFAGHIRH